VINALAWLLIGYSDGVIYWLIGQTGITGYVLYILPGIIVYILFLSIQYRVRFPQFLLRRQLLLIAFFAVVACLHLLTVGHFYFVGYVQLMTMVIMVFLMTDLFAANEALLRPGFAKGMLIVHYVICFYAVLAWIILRLFQADISLFVSDLDTLYGFAAGRTSGLHREPAWAGYALASSYLAVLTTQSRRDFLPQLAFLLAIAATEAGAGLVLAAILVGHQMITTRSTGIAIRLGLIAGVGVLVLAVFSERISEVVNENDPSTQMRIESSSIALEVIAETFPLGTGFGNYQDHANFDAIVWGGFLDIEDSPYYKSDIMILNMISELGLFGAILSIFFIANFACRGNLLVPVTAFIIMITSGTIIIPYYIVLAAISGLERGKAARLAAGREATAR
jgi:hypothetical protein